MSDGKKSGKEAENLRIAYFSPVLPQKTGVAAVVEPVLRHLDNFPEIDLELFIDGSAISISTLNYPFPVHDMSNYDNDDLRSQFHLAVYQVGNNLEFHERILGYFFRYGGILELHDISLYDLFYGSTLARNNTEEYIKCMRYCHGISKSKILYMLQNGEAVPSRVDPLRYPAIRHLIDRASAVIVHSDFARNYVCGISSSKPVISIPLPLPEQIALLDRKNSMSSNLVFGSFGYITKEKRIEPILNALSLLKQNNIEFMYYLVGQDLIGVGPLIRERQLENQVRYVGYVSEDEFNHYISICDLCLNLRNPTRGESSASLHWLLAQGKNVVVSDVGSFQEYPEEIVFKVSTSNDESSELYDLFQYAAQNRAVLKQREKHIVNYARRNFDCCSISKKYRDFFVDFYHYGTFYKNFMENLVDRLWNLGLTSKDYIIHICEDIVIKNLLRGEIL